MTNFKRLLLCAACLALLNGCAGKSENTPPVETPAAATPAPTKRPAYSLTDYFPFTENTQYRYTGEGAAILNQQSLTLFSDKNGMQVLTWTDEYEATDVYRIEDGELKVVYNDLNFYYDNLLKTPDVRHMTILKEPFELGATWNYDTEGAVCEITSLDAAVSVPYGEFETLEVTITQSDGNLRKDYYAPGVGLVMTGYVMNGVDISMDLSEIVPDATKPVEVDFYLVNTTLDTVEVEKRALELVTNIDFMDYFNTELRNTRSIDYEPLLPGKSEIRSMEIDWNEVLLTVDLSADYVKELQVGAGLESEVLQCLANTLGNFFNVHKVELLLGGRPYTSGHISKAAGEYWAVEGPDSVQ